MLEGSGGVERIEGAQMLRGMRRLRGYRLVSFRLSELEDEPLTTYGVERVNRRKKIHKLGV